MPPPDQDLPDEAVDQAIAAIRAQRPQEAQRLAADVLRSDPQSVGAHKVLGHALLMQGRYLDAIGPLALAAERDGDPATQTLLAKALAGAGRREEALAAARRAAERRPPFPMAFVELGEQLGDLGRFDEAIAVLEGGLALTPGAAVLRIGLGYLHLKRNDRAQARALFEQAYEAAPERPDAMIALARVSDHAAAADLYRRALERQPADAVTRISLGKRLLELGEREAGEVALREAVSGAAELKGLALTALAATPHGRLFLTPTLAEAFLRP